MRERLHIRSGQAIVEFALAATLIFLLLSAVIELGLIFFALQGMHNAAQDGAAFGSRWLSGSGPRVLDLNGIRERVRKESGTRGGNGFVNLLDLNNDGTPDVGPDNNAVVGASGTTYQNMPDGTRVIDNFIQLQMLSDTDSDGDPMDDLVGGAPTPCADPSAIGANCYIRVTVLFNYRTFFPLTPAFAKTTTLRSSYIMRIRDPFSQEGAAPTPPSIATMTPLPPTPTPVPLAVSVSRYTRASGTGNKPVSIKVSVTRGGVAISGAYVTAVVGTGASQTTVQLTDAGGGVYYACNVGSFSSLPTSTLSAVAGSSSGAATLSAAVGSASAACP